MKRRLAINLISILLITSISTLSTECYSKSGTYISLSGRITTIAGKESYSDPVNSLKRSSRIPDNNAPVMLADAGEQFDINEDSGNDNGTGADGDDDDINNSNNPPILVADLIKDGYITDADASPALESIAVVGIIAGNLVNWQYSIDGGSTWNSFVETGTEFDDIAAQARLLRSTDLIRAVTKPNLSGSTTLLFRAWDETEGEAGGTINANFRGGSTSLSETQGSVSLTVNPVNAVPGFVLRTTLNVGQSSGSVSVPFFASEITDGDPDKTQQVSFNITGNDNPDLFSVAPSFASSGTLTLTPNPTKFGIANITVNISDDGGTENGGVDTSADQSFKVYVLPSGISINEAHPAATSTQEFVEIYNGGSAEVDLSGLVLVLFNGSNDQAYKDIGLSGTLGANDFYVIGDADVPNLDLSWGSTDLQNGTDAIALYLGSESDFTSSSAPTRDGLISVLYYGSSSDEGLQAGLGIMEPTEPGDDLNAIARKSDGGYPFVLQEPTPGESNATSPPTVSFVYGDNVDNYFKSGAEIFIVIFFDQTVEITGTPRLLLETGDVDRYAEYSSGSGTDAIYFSYTVQPGDNAPALDYKSSNALELNGGTIQNATGLDAVLTLMEPGGGSSLSSISFIVVDSTLPTVSGVSSSTDNGTYTIDDLIEITVTFSEPVLVINTPQLILATGDTEAIAYYDSGSGTSTLTFEYYVWEGENSPDLDYVDINSLVLDGGTIIDYAVNTADLTLPVPGEANSLSQNKDIIIDTSGPVVVSVQAPDAKTYTLGQTLDFVIHFNEAVNIDPGTSDLAALNISVGELARKAIYSGGNGTSALTFSYTVQAGESDLDGVGIVDFTLGDGNITDIIGNDLSVTDLVNVASSAEVLVDGRPTIEFNNTSYSDDEFVDASFETLVLSGATIVDVTVDITFTGTASGDGSDYSGLNFTETIPAGTIYKDVNISEIVDDLLDEFDETVIITISNPVNAILGENTVFTYTIIDNDDEPVVGFASSAGSGGEEISSASVSVELSQVSGKDIQVDYSISGSATGAGTDYALANGTLTIPAGASSVSIDISDINDDMLDEFDETIVITLSNPINASLSAETIYTYTILDNDEAPSISFRTAGSSQSEEQENAAIQVDLSAASSKEITVDYEVSGTASGFGADYTLTNGTLTISAGSTSAEIIIAGIVNDAIDEEDETVVLTLSSPVNASLGLNAIHTYTIIDDDPEPTVILSVDNTTIAEEGGEARLTATLSAVSAKDVTVSLEYTGTATIGSDYNNTVSTTFLIPAGSLSADGGVTILASSDTDPEASETIVVSITGVTNGVEDGTQEVTITITDDDASTISFVSTEASGLESISSAEIAVELDKVNPLDITVDYTVTGTASSGIDYTLTSGTLTISAGTTSGTINIADIVADEIVETDETVIITLSDPVNAFLGVNTVHTYTITDDDQATVTIGNISVAEEEGVATVTLTLDKAVDGGFTLELSTADGTATADDGDYIALSGQEVVFGGIAGETQEVNITIGSEAKLEANESLTVSMDGLSPVTVSSSDIDITGTAIVTITNDDTATVTIEDASGVENEGAITLTATLSNAVQGGFTVDVNATDVTAFVGTDYSLWAGQTLTFVGTEGETQSFTITPINDDVEEVDETFIISMNNLASTSLVIDISAEATVTILNDDDNTAPSGYAVEFDDVLIGGGEASISSFTFAGAEIGTTYNYTVSSGSGGADITGSGAITMSTQQVVLADLSGLEDGILTLSVTLTDIYGNTGIAATDQATLDTTTPAAPVITVLSEDTGYSNSDKITSDNTPDINGIAEANSIIEVFVHGSSVGIATANSSGEWVLIYDAISSPLADGTISVSARATDEAGNIGPHSLAVNVTIDTSAPETPIILGFSGDSGSSNTDAITNDQTTMVVRGTAEANASLTMTFNGTTFSDISVDGNGDWSLDLSGLFAEDGTKTLEVIASDLAGNSSGEATYHITYDTQAPTVPTIGLASESDSGKSNTDNLTNDPTPTIQGQTEAGSLVEILLNGNSQAFVMADSNGDWTYSVSGDLSTGANSFKAKATDVAGNTSDESVVLTVVVDLSVNNPEFSPADDALYISPNTNLVLTFDEDINKGIGNISIKRTSDNNLIETISVVDTQVSISGGEVIINLEDALLSSATEFYVLIDAGAFKDNAGNSYIGISNNTDWTFTTLDAPTVTSVAVPSKGTYGIGSHLDFEINFSLPVTITGSPDIPLTIGDETVSAGLYGTVSNSYTATFRYTITEGNEDLDGISLASSINLNGGTIVDEFGVNATLGLNGLGATAGILVDGIKPQAAITSTVSELTNAAFTATFTYNESVTGFELSDITVTNGTPSNLTTVTAGKVWNATITPSTDGICTVTLEAAVVQDAAGNSSKAGNIVSTTFDGTAPKVTAITRVDKERLATGTASAAFELVFSEEVFGVDVTDLAIHSTGSVMATVSSVIASDTHTYAVTIDGISGEGTLGLTVKTDGNIKDAAGNPLSTAFSGEVYKTNFAPKDIGLTETSIQENNVLGAIVGTLSTEDADVSDSHSYSLVSGEGDEDNASFTISGANLMAAVSFDYETKTSYHLRVKVDDGFGGTLERTFEILITNQPEASLSIEGDEIFPETGLALTSVITWTLSNSGDAATTVNIVNPIAAFSTSAEEITLDAGASTNLTISFTPVLVEEYSGEIIFNYTVVNATESSLSKPLSGTGIVITGLEVPQITDQGISIFPNPTSDFVTIDLKSLQGLPVNIQVVNAAGVVIETRMEFKKPELRIDLTGYENGLYIIQFSNRESLVRKKIMIRK
ncbi:Calx-beta domain-containing protein [Roseivirga sp.]|uniref:Calx-beta domain-containing protein n=1 Tax=Roseivirga sp. TaxID=1964215 RepID=UPI003B518676